MLVSRGSRVEIVTIVTAGDVRAVDTAWGEGAFVGALERALLEGRIDLATHSAKDVPLDTALPIAAYPVREESRDVLVTRAGGLSLASLPEGAVVGTDSPRRAGFLRAERPDLRVVPLHGNVDTRLRRLDAGDVDALILAAAGLRRLGLADRIDVVLDARVMPPAPGQGALAVQVRNGGDDVAARVGEIDDTAVRAAVVCERATLAAAGGGCRAPLGATAEIVAEQIRLTAGFVAEDGRGRLIVERDAPRTDALRLAEETASAFLAAGYRGGS